MPDTEKVPKPRLPKYVVLQKKRGETPLELLTAWKQEKAAQNPVFKDIPLSYAGRLDPMAEGKLLVLVGDECKKQASYTKLDKEYEIEVVLGMKTDTGDVLGIAELGSQKKFEQTNLAQALSRELGAHSRRYPVFSSKTVQGKPLFLYALEGTLDTITIPEHIEKIYRIKKLSSEQLTSQELQNKIEDALAVVPRSDEPSKELGADFRQDAVRAKWREIFSKFPASLNSPSGLTFTILRLRVTCGSGAYMRSLAERIGMSLGTTAFALSINRTKIGKSVELGPIGFWSKEF